MLPIINALSPSNYYGNLKVMKRDEGCFWGIENYGSILWFPISEKLYQAIIEFDKASPDPDGVKFSDTEST